MNKNKTSVYKFYQFWINSSDEDAKNYIKIFSIKNRKEILELIKQHEKSPEKRLLQKTLANEVTSMVHSKKEVEEAIKASNILFGKSTSEDLKSLNEETFLSVFEGVQTSRITVQKLKDNLINILVDQNIFKSKGEARRMIESNAVSINKEKIDLNYTISLNDFINNKYLLIQKGKKNYFIIVLE